MAKERFVIVTIVALVILYLGVSYLSYDTISVSNAEKFIGIKLPDEATNYHLSYKGGLDASVRVKFDLPASSYERFLTNLAQLCFPKDLKDNFNPYPIDYDWWTPMQAQEYKGAQCHDEEFRYFRVLVDMTSREMYIIFLSAS